MIEPVSKDHTFLADVRSANQAGGFRIWWLGQSGFLLQWQGKHLLLDPYLSDSLTHKYADTDKPHVRMTERVVDPARLDFIDVVSSSHNHTDHLDAETLLPLMRANPQLRMVIPEANRAFVADRLAIDARAPIGLTAGETKEVGGFEFTGIPAAHNELETDEQGRHRYLGYVVRFGVFTVYHSGDTLRYPGLAGRLREFNPDLMLLPINGDRPERRVAGNLNGREAAQLAHDVGGAWVVPCHYEMFEFNTASPAEFVAECHRLGQLYRVLRAGERLDSSTLDNL